MRVEIWTREGFFSTLESTYEPFLHLTRQTRMAYKLLKGAAVDFNFQGGAMFRRFAYVLAIALLVTSCGRFKKKSESSWQAPPEPFPHFGTSANFAALAGQAIMFDGDTTLYGDLGVSPGTEISGLGRVKRTGGATHINDAVAIRAQSDAATAYKNVKNKACETDLSGQNLGGLTLRPGTYCFSEEANLNGLLTLDFGGNPNANFVFQIADTFVVSAESGIRMLNHGETCNVFWQVSNSAVLESKVNFIGGILAINDITLKSGVMLNGKLHSKNGNVIIEQSEIYNNFCPWPAR